MFGTTLAARVAHCWQLSFLHIQYQGTGAKVVDHAAANLSQLEAAQDVPAEGEIYY